MAQFWIVTGSRESVHMVKLHKIKYTHTQMNICKNGEI